MNKEIKLANPRGFCAGVDRAIDIVNRALDIYGPPVYVKHEVVHNKVVVNDLKNRGAVFVEEIDEIPDPFNTPPIIGRTKVLKTFVEKIFLSDETEFNSDGYSDDIKKIIISFNALVYQLNVKVKEISF